MFNIIDPAYAQSAGALGGFDFMGIMPFVVIFVAFYFILIRPQQKKAQQQRDMINQIQRGDQVITAGGIIGVVDAVEESQVVLRVEDGAKIRVIKSSVAEKISGQGAAKSASQNTDNVRPLKGSAVNKKAGAVRKPAKKTTKKS